jgi:hypothetical protein
MQPQPQDKNSAGRKRRKSLGSEALGGLSTLTEGLDLRNFLVAMAVLGGVTLVAWLASHFWPTPPSPPPLPDVLIPIQEEAGFKELIKKISPEDLARHYRCFRELRPKFLGEAIPGAVPGDVSFVDLYTLNEEQFRSAGA